MERENDIDSPFAEDWAEVGNLHIAHPQIRAEDWRSPLVLRLSGRSEYQDGDCTVRDSFRPGQDGGNTGVTVERRLRLRWLNLRDDFQKCIKTYQDAVLTEFAALGLACILVAERLRMEISEVTRRGEKVDYWLGDRDLLLEVSGAQVCDLEALCEKKAQEQLLRNPFGRSGFVCVVDFSTRRARLWFYPYQPR
jgi:hypothetical protein